MFSMKINAMIPKLNMYNVSAFDGPITGFIGKNSLWKLSFRLELPVVYDVRNYRV